MSRKNWLPLTVSTILFALLAGGPSAQLTKPIGKLDPVKWTLVVEPAKTVTGGHLLGRLTATIEEGWRLYAPTTPAGGPIPTKLEIVDNEAVASWTAYQTEPETKFDPNFNLESQSYSGKTTFLFNIELDRKIQAGVFHIESTARYNACNDRLCLPPVKRSANAIFQIVTETTAATPIIIPADYSEIKPSEITNASEDSSLNKSTASSQQEGFLGFAAVAFGFGILAVFTPCVFPMIPITLSYFIATGSGSQSQSLRQAATFCVGVIVFFTGIGATVSAVLGPFGISQMGSNPWVNLFIALVFMTFGASLLGAFEITVPSSALTFLNRVSNRGDMLGTLVMGLVFALSSFACIGPFMGTLLAGSIKGNLTWPVLGMMIFSMGLVLPFFFLTLFPVYLSRLPKSGNWLIHTKVTIGFLILAISVKYLSNVDQLYQWFLLTRERVLAIWIVLLAMAGLYLLGTLRIAGNKASPVGYTRLAFGILILVLAISLIPGMIGNKLGELEVYIPPPEYSHLREYTSREPSDTNRWIKNDYNRALQLARQENKAVLVSFTGYTCTNCHWMKINMFTKPELAKVLDTLILVELYTDGIDEASQANQSMQLERFQTVAIPYYVIIGSDDNILAEFPGRTRDVKEFHEFLNAGRS